MVSCGGSGTLVTSGVGVVVTVPRTEVDTVSDGDGDSATFSRRCRGRNVNSDRARMRVLVKRILRKYGYPPDLEDAAVQTVLQQAELLSESWAA